MTTAAGKIKKDGWKIEESIDPLFLTKFGKSSVGNYILRAKKDGKEGQSRFANFLSNFLTMLEPYFR